MTEWGVFVKKMKVKILSRNPADYTRQSSTAIAPSHYNPDPALHPLAAATEYTRALQSAKLERIFAKPFLRQLSGHIDAVTTMCVRYGDVNTVGTGSADGEVRWWRLSTGECKAIGKRAHQGAVGGIGCWGKHVAHRAVSAGALDKVIRIWDVSAMEAASSTDEQAVGGRQSMELQPMETYVSEHVLGGLDTHHSSPLFCTASGTGTVQVWSLESTSPLHSFAWGSDTVLNVRWNRVEQHILASCATDRSVVLYDLRMRTPLARMITQLRTNALAWNPMEAFIFTTANEDHNMYTFDMRKMDHAINIMKDHVSAVLDVDYSPTGEMIVSGSYDRTIRLYDVGKHGASGHSRDVYHTKRMQKVMGVRFSMDSRFILSASDEGNVRVWKAKAHDQLGPRDWRERRAGEYRESLKERYKHVAEVRHILKRRNTPKPVKKAQNVKRDMLSSRKQKEENRRKHSKGWQEKRKVERQQVVLKVET